MLAFGCLICASIYGTYFIESKSWTYKSIAIPPFL